MKFATLVILAAALHQAQAQNVIADGAIDGISNGIISAKNSDINSAQAKSEVDQLIKHIASNPILYSVLDEMANGVMSGFDQDTFPAFVTKALNGISSYEGTPDFTSARSLISSYLPHYNLQSAILYASSNNELYYGLLTGNIDSYSGVPAVQSAVTSALSGITKFMSDLGLLGGATVGPSSSAASTSSGSPSSTQGPSSSAVESFTQGPTSSSNFSTSALSSSAGFTTVAPSTTGGFVSTDDTFSETTGSTPVSTDEPFPTSSDDFTTDSATDSESPFTTVINTDHVTSTLTQTITHCDDNKCITPTLTLTTVVPTNPATTTIETVIEGVTVTITVPCDTTAAPKPTTSGGIVIFPTTQGPQPTGTTIFVGGTSTIVLVDSSEGNGGFPSPTPTGQNGFTQLVPPASSRTITYVTQTLTRTLTHCVSGLCVTPTLVLTTRVPTNAPDAIYQTVVQGITHTLTLPYDTNPVQPTAGPLPTGNPGTPGTPGTPGAPGAPVAPHNSGIPQANGASTFGVSVAAAVAGAMVFLL